MEQSPKTPMTPFDLLTEETTLHTMKLLLPYLPSQGQKTLALYIRLSEMHHTLDFFNSCNTSPKETASIFSQDCAKKSPSLPEILAEIAPYLSGRQKDWFDQLQSALQMMELLQNSDLADLSASLYNDSDRKEASHAPKQSMVSTPDAKRSCSAKESTL